MESSSSSRPSSNTSRPPSITRNCRDSFVASFEPLPPETPQQNELNEEVVDIGDNVSDDDTTSSNIQEIKDREKNTSSRPTSKESTSSASGENEIDDKIRKGLKKIEKLDNILAKKIKKEKQVKKERREFEKEFKNEVESLIQKKGKNNVCGSDQLLALCNATSSRSRTNSQSETVESIFSTQIDAKYYESHFMDTNKHFDKTSRSKSGSPEKKHTKKTDFVNRNIELASNPNDGVMLTEDEKERLEKLLADDKGLLFVENPFSTPAITDTAYTFTELELKSINDIDLKLKELIPESDLELRSIISESEVDQQQIITSPRKNDLPGSKFSANETMTSTIEGSDSLLDITHVEVDCGEKVLQEKRDERTLNKRLKDIDQELKRLKSLDDDKENASPIDPDLLVMLLDTDSRLTSSAVSICESVSSKPDFISVEINREEVLAK